MERMQQYMSGFVRIRSIRDRFGFYVEIIFEQRIRFEVIQPTIYVCITYRHWKCISQVSSYVMRRCAYLLNTTAKINVKIMQSKFIPPIFFADGFG